jgi:hypothetical protein
VSKTKKQTYGMPRVGIRRRRKLYTRCFVLKGKTEEQAYGMQRVRGHERRRKIICMMFHENKSVPVSTQGCGFECMIYNYDDV